MTKLLVPSHFTAAVRERTEGLPLTIVGYDKDGTPVDDSTGAEVFFRWWLSVPTGDRIISEHPALRWIHTGSAGVDHILTPTFLESKIVLTNSSGVHATSIAEWVVTAILALAKDLPRLLEQQRGHVWETVERNELSGRRAVILGAGHIAREIATRLRPFGVVAEAVSRSATPSRQFDSVFPSAELPDRLRGASWLIVTIPLTAQTRGLVDARFLALLPRDAVVVNVARGELVDEQALAEALVAERIGGAVLDVFTQEPLPADHPLWDVPRCIVLPHTTWRSPQVRMKQIDLFVRNLRNFLADAPLENVVDPARGY
jgi:phosphoglycerate dehydrogenase-like enzyme